MNYTEEELEFIIDKAVEKALKIIPSHLETCPLSTDDIVFFKRMKMSIDTTASWLGHGFILMILGGVCYIVKLGIDAWRATPNG